MIAAKRKAPQRRLRRFAFETGRSAPIVASLAATVLIAVVLPALLPAALPAGLLLLGLSAGLLLALSAAIVVAFGSHTLLLILLVGHLLLLAVPPEATVLPNQCGLLLFRIPPQVGPCIFGVCAHIEDWD